MHTGTISKLVPLTSQSEVERTQLVRGHNEMGYGNIDGPHGETVYFHHDTVEECPFNELWVGQEVEYELADGDEPRAKRVRLLHDDADPGRGGVRMPPLEGYASTRELPGSPAAGNKSAHDEAADGGSEHDSEQLLAALEQLERQLESPAVPGELPSWLNGLQGPVEEVKRVLPAVIRGQHASTLQSIAQEDMELQRRVEQLRAEDKRIIDEYGADVVRWYMMSNTPPKKAPQNGVSGKNWLKYSPSPNR